MVRVRVKGRVRVRVWRLERYKDIEFLWITLNRTRFLQIPRLTLTLTLTLTSGMP